MVTYREEDKKHLQEVVKLYSIELQTNKICWPDQQQKKKILYNKKKRDFKVIYILHICMYLLTYYIWKEKSQCISQEVTQKRLMNSTKCPHKTPCSSEDIFAYIEKLLWTSFWKGQKKPWWRGIHMFHSKVLLLAYAYRKVFIYVYSRR